MRVLFVASEGVPFVKTGGLGDVIGSLPKELQKQGLEVAVIMPKYGGISQHLQEQMTTVKRLAVPLSWRQQYCGLQRLVYQDVIFYFIDNQEYFNRPGYYGYQDDGERFAFFCQGVLASLPHLDFKPQILHCHDWHTAMISVLWHAQYRWQPYYRDLATVFTIHNLKYQGIFPKEILGELLGLNVEYFSNNSLEFFGMANFMKGALVYSDAVTTVSRTYAQEIQNPYYGEKLDGLLRYRRDALVGIVNGIDYQEFDPSSDERIFAPFTKADLAGKAENKRQLQAQLNLPIRAEVPLLAIISRLVDQKGLDLVQGVFHQLLGEDIQLVILGTGDREYQVFFSHMASQYPTQLSANIYYNEELAHRIYAGVDMFLMPSRFEPCGLGQLIALRYGTIPIVRETGGLVDTIAPYNEYTDEGFGFSFSNYNAHDMLYTINRAISFYRQQSIWRSMVIRAMEQDFSWQQSAGSYRNLYQQIIQQKKNLLGGLA